MKGYPRGRVIVVLCCVLAAWECTAGWRRHQPWLAALTVVVAAAAGSLGYDLVSRWRGKRRSR